MNKRPSVLVFSTQLLGIGGIESHIREFCYNMIQSGVEIDLVVLNSSLLPETEKFYRQYCRQVYIGVNGNQLKKVAWILLMSFKLGWKHFDSVYTNGHGNSIYLFRKLLFRCKLWVHHHHSIGDAADQANWGNSYINVLLNADNIVACSSTNEKNMKPFLRREIDIIPCFSYKAESGKYSRVLSKKLKFGYYGRLIPEKGIDILCRLSNDPECSSIEFHLWGEGVYPASYFDRFSNLVFHGPFKGREGLCKITGMLDAYLLISKHGEGLPVSLLEAMSIGLPWIATDRGGIKDIACDSTATKVISSTSSYAQIKEAVLTLADDLYAGKVSTSLQIEQYIQKYSAPTLVSKWRQILGLNNYVSKLKC